MVRRIISSAALVTALAAVPLVAAGPAQSIPACKSGYQCTRTYYQDNTYTTPIGGFTRFCDGTIDEWGETSRYVETTQAQCPQG